MYKINIAKRKEYITPYTKEAVESLLKANNDECGYEDGYEAAMEEMEEGKASHRMGQRSRMY
jgi:hypothetical protein